MHGQYSLDCLEFNQNFIINEQVDTVSQLKLNTIENDRQCDLCLNPESSFSQCMSKTSFVGTFQQSRPESRVNLKRGLQYSTSDRV